MYGGEILHADACHPCAGPLRGLTRIGVIDGKKMNVVKLCLHFCCWRLKSRCSGPWILARQPCRWLTDRTAAAARCWQLTYSNPLRGQSSRWSAKRDSYSTGWSAQCDKHGALKPKWNNIGLFIYKVHGRPSACIDPEVKSSKFKVTGVIKCSGSMCRHVSLTA